MNIGVDNDVNVGMNSDTPISARYRNLLLCQVYDFYRYPGDYLDPSWLTGDPHQGVIEQLQKHSESRRYLSDHLLQQFGLSPRIDCEFTSNVQRLVLLSREQLQHIIMLGGLIAYSTRIPKRSEVVGLPVELHRFSLTKARFLVKTAPVYCIEAEITNWMNEELVEQGVCTAGLNMLAMALHELPQSARQRLALKLPRSLEGHFDVSFNRDATSDKIQESQRLMLKLYRETEPSCYLLFD